jgi:hypothetical protein
MSRSTPLVSDGYLHSLDGNPWIPLDSPAWFSWLQETQHCTFHFQDVAGGFTARKEVKQRGQVYWVAYRQFHNKLHKTYLGKAEALTYAHLTVASNKLAHACTC